MVRRTPERVEIQRLIAADALSRIVEHRRLLPADRRRHIALLGGRQGSANKAVVRTPENLRAAARVSLRRGRVRRVDPSPRHARGVLRVADELQPHALRLVGARLGRYCVGRPRGTDARIDVLLHRVGRRIEERVHLVEDRRRALRRTWTRVLAFDAKGEVSRLVRRTSRFDFVETARRKSLGRVGKLACVRRLEYAVRTGARQLRRLPRRARRVAAVTENRRVVSVVVT